MKPLRIALTKGRLEKTTIELLEKIGYNCDEVKNKGRRLILRSAIMILKSCLRKPQM